MRGRSIVGLVGFVALMACACGGKKDEQAAATPPPTTPAAAFDAAPPAPPKLAMLDEKRVVAVIGDWLLAQNDGSFENYEKLYAADFKGVLRVGAKARDMDRAAWMESRAKMFKNAMTVGVAGMNVRTLPKTATVTFVQSFESGRFRDRGPKRIEVADIDGDLRITSEVMLESLVTRGMKRVDEGFNNLSKLPKNQRVGLQALKPGWDIEMTHPMTLADGRAAMLVFMVQDMNDLDDDQAGMSALGALFGIAVEKGDGYELVASVAPRVERQLELSYYDERDIDGDAAPDTIIVYHGTAFHEAWDGVFIVLSKTSTVYDLVYAGGGGEGGEYSWRSPTYACVTQIDGKAAFITTYQDVLSLYEGDTDQSVETKTFGFTALVDDGSKLAPTTVYGWSTQTAASPEELLGAWRSATGERSVTPTTRTDYERSDTLTEVPRCYGKDEPAFIVGGAAVKGHAGPFHLISGLSLTKDGAAKRRAAAAPGAKAIEIESAKFN